MSDHYIKQIIKLPYPPSLDKLSDLIDMHDRGYVGKRVTENYIYSTLSSAIKEGDEDIVELITKKSDLSLHDPRNKKVPNFFNLALDSKNTKIISMVLDKIKLDPQLIVRTDGKYKSLDVLKYLVEKSKKQYAIKNNISNNTNEGGREIKYEHIWNSLYLYNLLIQSQYSKSAVKYLDTQFDDILNSSLRYDGILKFLKTCPSKDNEWHKSILQRVSLSNWNELFSTANKHINEVSDLTYENIEFFNDFLKENKNIRNLLNAANKKMMGNYKNWQNWWDKYLPINMPIEQTPFYKIISNLVLSKSQHSYAMRDEEKYGKYYLDIYINNNNSKARNLVCLNENDFIRLISSKFLSMRNIENMVDQYTKKPCSLEGEIPVYSLPSMMHVLFCSNSSVIVQLLKSSKGRDFVENCLNDVNARQNFMIRTDTKILSQIVKALPQFKDFKDDLGNNLAHIYIKIRNEKRKTKILDLYKINKHWFYEKDNNGKYIVDLLRDNKMEEVHISSIERKVLKDSLSLDEDLNKVIRSKNKQIKKKM